MGWWELTEGEEGKAGRGKGKSVGVLASLQPTEMAADVLELCTVVLIDPSCQDVVWGSAKK